ncbi:predicted protein [Histoplasma capsulatum G186AR]|uniref:Uncharacterized protein n=1 Tax=Ajellomyces capsulatus (strain G186AR / H82 / ATCC MYA-2454 / RMSCC 2432) TaxID=447093 RepID=C0NA94_AJECG|nr:uncharacterized protein HCBG_00040 [Histoplasma capsulatum G186AR]EEH10585.1 predicted protein [Histoplasma capsulatum G186AR]
MIIIIHKIEFLFGSEFVRKRTAERGESTKPCEDLLHRGKQKHATRCMNVSGGGEAGLEVVCLRGSGYRPQIRPPDKMVGIGNRDALMAQPGRKKHSSHARIPWDGGDDGWNIYVGRSCMHPPHPGFMKMSWGDLSSTRVHAVH